MNFENTVITKYWPAEEKSMEGEMLPQLIIQCEAELDNAMQTGFLFTSMVKGLMQISFTNPETGESFELESATIKPFNVKQKKMKIGKGEDATVVMAEFAQMKIVTLMDDDGELMKELFPFFNRQLAMNVDDLPSGPVIRTHNEIEDEIGPEVGIV